MTHPSVQLLFVGGPGYVVDAAMLDGDVVTYRFGTQLAVQRHAPSGELRWRTEVGADGRDSWDSRLAVTPAGEVRVWVSRSHAEEEEQERSGLPRRSRVRALSPSGTPLWSQDVAGCSPERLQSDAQGAVTFVAGAGCGRVEPRAVARLSVQGSEALRFEEATSGVVRMQVATSPTGDFLVGGSRTDFGSWDPTWVHVDGQGRARARHAVAGIQGSLQPLLLEQDGWFLAQLLWTAGQGAFAGQPIACAHPSSYGCRLLLTGSASGEERSLASIPYEETVVHAARGQVVTSALRGTELVLRRRALTGQLLAESVLADIRTSADETVARVVGAFPQADGSLLVVAYARGTGTVASQPLPFPEGVPHWFVLRVGG